MTTNTIYSIEKTLLGRLGLIYQTFLSKGDTERAEKVLEIFKKIHHQQIAICFTGHFSAGKSSMLNELMGEDLLASSPIPTSANLVTIKNGGLKAILTDIEGTSFELKPPYTLDELQSITKNGEITRMDLYHPHVPEHLIFMDTPGIDSTDDKHKEATENALYLADAIFYMVDYNHVQSSSNYQYLKELSGQQKPLYLVVNQVDKHHQDEVDFDAFKEQVQESLSHWAIPVRRVFYTSLRNTRVPNDLSDLKAFIQQLASDPYDITRLQSTLNRLTLEHRDWYRKEANLDPEELEEYAEPYQLSDLQKLTTLEDKKEEELNGERMSPETWYNKVKEQINQTIKSAILMPYETRELARLYLESHEPGFKVGFLFSKKKTDEEREIRLNAFQNSVQAQATTLEHHIREVLEHAITTSEEFTGHSDLMEAIYNIKLNISSDLITKAQNEGARSTGQYILNYTEELASTIKKQALKHVLPILEQGKEILTSKVSERTEALRFEIKELAEKRKSLEKLQNLLKAEGKVKKQLFSLLETDFNELSPTEEIVEQLLLKEEHLQVIPINVSQKEKQKEKPETVQLVNQKEPQKPNAVPFKTERKRLVEVLSQGQQLLQEIKGFRHVAQSLSHRIERLESNHFVIALFGAFSAGKSSFANALLGDLILPVSPHPTTATINRVMPVTDEYPHGTVHVKLKNQEALFKELSLSAEKLGLDIHDPESLLREMNQEEKESYSPTQRLHYTFLKAAKVGYESIRSQIGKTLTISLKQVQAYIAQETKACFVDSVSIYYDCPLTQDGVILVDTPGADSINARHTDVAFDYIKNSDAIIYVTYYNHAFSRADQEFLRQLGRVKDTFTLDKMFFIVNAIDLASSAAEKEDVLNYMNDALRSFGIRSPRLFGVSSLLSLYSEKSMQGKLTVNETERYKEIKANQGFEEETDEAIYKQSLMPQFKQKWFDFTSHELLSTLIFSSQNELKQVLSSLKERMEINQLEAVEREAKLQQLKDHYNKALQQIADWKPTYLVKSLSDQIEELIFYIKKRLMVRYYEEFKVFFNPSVLHGGKKDVKEQLNTCLNEFIDFLSFDLDQEIQATELRVEAFIKQQADSTKTQMLATLAKIERSFLLTTTMEWHFQSPAIHQHLNQLKERDYTQVLRLFKTPKQFFEGKGHEEMRSDLEPLISQSVDEVLEKNKAMLNEEYTNMVTIGFEQLKEQLHGDLVERYEAEHDVLSHPESTEVISQSYDNINEIVTTLKDMI